MALTGRQRDPAAEFTEEGALMFTISVKANTQPAVDYLNSVAKGLGDRAIVSSLNKTMAQARTQMIRGITKEFAITYSKVAERLRIIKARKAGMQFSATLVGNPEGRNKRAMNLTYFVAAKATVKAWKKQAGKGGGFSRPQIQFRIKRGKGLTHIKGAFILNKAGQPVVRWDSRGKLVGVTTVGVPQMFMAKKVQVPIQQWIDSEFPRIFDREARYFLSTVK